MFEVGEQVGAYTIVRRLGAGGMGEVYLGRHRHIAREAAIKVLLPELSQNEDVVARFFTEARATATIRHPGIVEILDCDIHRTGRAYIVMEFLDGENLAERLVRQRSFAEDQGNAGVILAQAASAVGAAHAKGIVHRDLKPDNVFLVGAPDTGAPPLVKILDFGVAKLVSDDGQGRNKTRTGSLLGTPTYMSPEQCRGAGSIDHRTDVYALGCMAFEVLSGRPPFVRDGAGEVLVAHLVEKPPQLSSLVPSVPPELDALIGQMLEKDAAARPQSMAEIASRVEGIFGIVSTFTPPAEGLSGAMRLPGAGRTPAFGAAVSPASSTPTAAGQAFQRPATPLPGKTAAASPSPPAPAPAPAAPHVIAGGTRVMQAVSSRTTLSDSASEKSTRQRTPPPSVPRRRWLLPAIAGGSVVVAGIVAAMAFGPSEPKKTPAPPAPPQREVAPPPAPPPPRPEPRPPVEVTIEVSSDPAGAEVWFPGDESARGTTPLKVAMRRGEPPVSVTLKASGYLDTAVTLNPAREEAGPLNISMEKARRKSSSGGDSGKGKGKGKGSEHDIYKPMGD